MSVFILHTTLLNWWETTFIYLLIHRMICIRVTHSLSLSLTVGGIQKKKERKTDPRGLHLSVLHAKRVSVLLCHFISFHPQTARGDRHVTSLSHDIHTSFSKRVIRILVGLLVGWKLLSPSDTKFLQGPSHAHSSSEVQIQSLPGKVKVGKKKRPTKDQVLHRHWLRENNQQVKYKLNLSLGEQLGKRGEILSRSFAVVEGLLTAVTSPCLQLQQLTCKGRNCAGVM